MADGQKRINFDLPEDEWLRLNHLRWGMRSHILRTLVALTCDLWDKGGDGAMVELVNGDYVLLPRSQGHEPPKPAGVPIPDYDA